MNKKTVGIVISIIIVLAVIAGVVYAINRNSSNGEQTTNETKQENTVKTDNTTNNAATENKNETVEEDVDPRSGNRVLIAYFSRADENYNVGTVEVGNTEIMAGYIKDYFGDNADTYKIEPTKAYPTSYDECTKVAKEELNSNVRPEIKNKISNFDQYDIVFIGYPIWWGEVPMIINTFLESYDFSNKTVIPFNTNEGSGDAGTYTYIKNKLTSSEVNTKGLAIKGSDVRGENSKQKVLDWIMDLGF